MVSHKVLVAIILLNVYIGVQSVFYLFGGVLLTVLFAMAFLNGPRLLDWASSPPHLQFNKYVLTGYRPISSVQDCIRSLFYLHNELGNIYTHVVTKPPYEITETGWGEFEIIIKIFFIDPNERPVTLYHLLKLFQSDSSAMPKKTVVSEFYDEMIFQDPTAMMQQLLTTSRQLTLGAYKHETEFSELEQRTKEKMEAAKKRTSQEITELKDKLKASRENINHLKAEIRKLEEDGDHKEH